MKDDATLLQEYARERNEAAFAELVRRHVNFVYAAALRQVNGDRTLAEDITQAVFVDLARKAPALAAHRGLTGWLFTSTRFAAAKAVRTEQRRRVREQEAQRMHEDSKPDGVDAAEWERLRPLLDTALSELPERDRVALLLRYLQGCDYAEVGARLQLSDNAARMCADRALEKLRGRLARHGVTSTTAALALALTAETAVAAPAALAGTVTATALTTAATGTGALVFLGLTKLQWAAVGTLALAGVGTGWVQQQATQRLRAELATLAAAPSDAELGAQRERNDRLGAAVDEAARLRVAPEEWARLQAEAEALRVRLEREATEARVAAATARQRAKREALDLKQLDEMPKPMRRAAPRYPAAMREVKADGHVVVEFVIADDGHVVDATVLQSSAKDFEAPTIEAVKQWQFTPGRKGGVAVATRAKQVFEYQSSNDDGPPPPGWF